MADKESISTQIQTLRFSDSSMLIKARSFCSPLMAALLLSQGAAFELLAAEFSITDYHKFNQECQLSECRDFEGKVASVIPDAEGALIRFKATKVRHFQKQSHPDEKPPRRGAESYEMYELNPKSPPMVWQWEEAISETLSLRWNKADGPVPVCSGMSANVTLDSAGSLQDITFLAATTHWRKRSDGLVEVVLGYKEKGEPQRLLYVVPARISGGTDIHWTRKWGLLVTTDAAGPDTVEIESISSAGRALPLTNTEEIKVVPGRDGWHSLPQFNEELREPTPAEDRAWRAFFDAIPQRQTMRGAG